MYCSTLPDRWPALPGNAIDGGIFFRRRGPFPVWAHSQQLINLVMKDERQASQTEQAAGRS